jgi:uncharacterized protein (DUF427 family)
MGKSPGHRKWPNHRVDEKHLKQRWQVTANGKVIAESDDVIRVDEDGQRARLYFPRASVQTGTLQRSSTETQCPFKGTAHYFDVKLDGTTLHDAVWSYEEPYEEHASLKDRVAFYDDKIPELVVRRAPEAAIDMDSTLNPL